MDAEAATATNETEVYPADDATAEAAAWAEVAPSGAATEAVLARLSEAGEPLPAAEPAAPGCPIDDSCEPEYAGKSMGALVLVAAGIVFGDIGTSPLYVLQACFAPEHRLTPDAPTVYGVLSLIVWSLILVVSVKYAAFVMRADHRGEGGILALLALAVPYVEGGRVRHPKLWIGAALFGAALLYGDGMVTPALSILSAVEGLRVATPAFEPYVVPLAVGVILGLFAVQRRGTHRVGQLFGPVMLLWFAAIALLGAAELARHPQILGALNPAHALRFVRDHGLIGFLALGAVVLAVTGAEALYADIGHCGKRPIRLTWYAVVLPCLLLSYFGQGALLLRDRGAAANPFFHLAPQWSLIPLVVLATAATSIASQALISGAFSLTRQLMHLGYSPLVTVTHTSAEQEGQVYVPQVNAMLLVGCLLLVLAFRSSERLVGAYGLAVSGTMTATSVLFYVVARHCWRWSAARAGALVALFLAVDLAFLGANVAKILHGGWIPLAVALAIYTLCITWRRGREFLLAQRARERMSLDTLFGVLERERPCRTPGTAVFLTLSGDDAPAVLRHHLEHIPALHERVILLGVEPADAARVGPARRVAVEPLEHGFVRVTARYGYMQRVRVSEILDRCAEQGLAGVDPERTTFYVARERVQADGGGVPMAHWRKRLFAFLQRNAPSAQDFMALPPGRVVELGSQVVM
ncbi:MAG TPA: potassium transporter Kup [Gemmatimonadaceae bacterium]|nr:potassium transporter Kup [Gemmatimonadaceae bacterium]